AVAPARRAAYEVVLRVFEQDAYADRALGAAVAGLDARDRALAQQIAYGTVQRVRALDHGIETLSRRPVTKLDPPVRASRRLDPRAAPGGQATQLAGEVVAVEKHDGRARELAENVACLRATNVRIVRADALELPAELAGFDHVLVDAPCSGLGVLNRRPDLRWRSKPLPELQRELLGAAAERTRPGGTILYSVCTLNADENEAIVDASGLEPEPLGDEWPEFAHPKRPEFLLTTPNRHATSGFFIARLRR